MMSSIAALLKRYPIAVFFTLTFIISWLPWYTGWFTGFFVFGPTLIGLSMTAVTGGRKGFRDLHRRVVRWRVGIGWWGIALFLPAFINLVGIGIHVLLGGELPEFTFFRQEWYLAPLFFVAIMIIGGPMEEEFGWRGYALPKLQSKWSPLIASLIIGTAWGIWHLPEFFRPGSSQYPLGIGFLPMFTVTEIASSIWMTWLYNKTKGSLLLGGIIFHTALNFWSTTLLIETTATGILRGEAFPPIDLMLFFLEGAVATLAAVILIIVTKGRLGFAANDGRGE